MVVETSVVVVGMFENTVSVVKASEALELIESVLELAVSAVELASELVFPDRLVGVGEPRMEVERASVIVETEPPEMVS